MSWITKWKNNKQHYSWKQIELYCKKSLSVWKGEPPEMVIGLSRGGWIPAVIAAQYFSVRELYSIGLYSYPDQSSTPSGVITQYQSLPINLHNINNRRVLVVDDISDKGKTFEHVVRKLKATYKCDIKTMSVFIKEKTCFVPDYYYRIEPEKQWIVFPWEQTK